jgi:hypothetical protein
MVINPNLIKIAIEKQSNARPSIERSKQQRIVSVAHHWHRSGRGDLQEAVLEDLPIRSIKSQYVMFPVSDRRWDSRNPPSVGAVVVGSANAAGRAVNPRGIPTSTVSPIIHADDDLVILRVVSRPSLPPTDRVLVPDQSKSGCFAATEIKDLAPSNRIAPEPILPGIRAALITLPLFTPA